MKARSLIFFLVLIFVKAATAQQTSPLKEMTADLPDETEETRPLERGQLQTELGYSYTHFQEGPHPSIAQAMIRYGAFRRVEFRLLMEEGYARDRYMEETVQATYPLAAGAKLALLEDHPVLPDITFVGYLKLPFTSHNQEQSNYWSPILSLAFQHRFGRKWTLEYNGGGQQEAFGDNWSAFLNSSLHYHCSERLEVFGEYYGQYQASASHNAGLGVFYQVTNGIGIYGVGGRSIASEPANFFLSAGLVLRRR